MGDFMAVRLMTGELLNLQSIPLLDLLGSERHLTDLENTVTGV